MLPPILVVLVVLMMPLVAGLGRSRGVSAAGARRG
jgi:hypothetical protein